MTDVLRNKFDLKTVIGLILFITALAANYVKSKDELQLAIEIIKNDYKSKISDLKAEIKNRDDLQDRDIQDVKNQQKLDEEVIKGQNFLIGNIQKDLINKK